MSYLFSEGLIFRSQTVAILLGIQDHLEADDTFVPVVEEWPRAVEKSRLSMEALVNRLFQGLLRLLGRSSQPG